MTDAIFNSVNTPDNSGLGARIKSFFVRTFEAISHARELEARRKVGYYLANLDDETLKNLGFKRDEIKRWN